MTHEGIRDAAGHGGGLRASLAVLTIALLSAVLLTAAVLSG